MGNFERLVLWVYSFLFSILMLVLTIMAAGWKEPLLVLDMALGDFNQRWLIGIVGAFLFLLGLYALLANFRSKPIKHAIVKTTQLGDVCISIDAIEALVIKASGKVLGIREIKPVIKPTEQGIAILIKGTATAEENIPQVSEELQETVKNTVEAIAGVTVIEVRVIIKGISKELRGRVE